jgi:hypothetical protein
LLTAAIRMASDEVPQGTRHSPKSIAEILAWIPTLIANERRVPVVGDSPWNVVEVMGPFDSTLDCHFIYDQTLILIAVFAVFSAWRFPRS